MLICNRRIFSRGVLAAGLLWSSSFFLASQSAKAEEGRVVVMISVDGLAGFYMNDPKAEMPTIRQLATEGAQASSMKASVPTVTWPNHTTLVTGDEPAKHGVVGNNYFDREKKEKVALIADPVYDKEQIVKAPTIYDAASKAGMKTAAVRWPATRNASTLDWTIPSVASAELVQKYTTPSLVTECEANGIMIVTGPDSLAQRSQEHNPSDDVCTHVFNFILQKHRPNLALLHVVNVDHQQHLNGPRTPEAYAAIKEADGFVREVWDELKKDFPGKATLIVTSDHGFSPIRRLVLPNIVLRGAGIVGADKNDKANLVDVVSQGGSSFIYVRDQSRRDQVLGKVRKAFTGVEGVAKIVGCEEFEKYGVADPKVDSHAPDMILFANEGIAFGDTAAGSLPFQDKPESRGTHGHDPNLPNLHATFVAWGEGIKPGAKLGEISNTQVAPTIAKLLGLNLPNTDGKPLAGALSE